MDTTASLTCLSFLQKCPADRREALFWYLPVSEQKNLSTLPLPTDDLSEGIETLDEQLKRIHFSWFSSFLRTLSEMEARLFLSALSGPQVNGLKKMLLLTNHQNATATSEFVKGFLQKTLWEKIAEKDLLPWQCLPASSLNELLKLSDRQLELCISLLGLHDLSVEMRMIIETAKLKKIQAILSVEQQHYLKEILQKKEPLTFPRMALEKWDRKEETLKNLIQQRGLNRIAKALSSEHPSLLWHVSHKMDIEKAETLKKLSAPIKDPRASAFLAEQILEVISYIQTHITT